MDKARAELLCSTISRLLTKKKLVRVSVTPLTQLVVRVDQSFKGTYFVSHADGSCVVAISDSYGVMSGAETWSIASDTYSIHAETTNNLGEPCRFTWALQEPTKEDWFAFRDTKFVGGQA